MGWPLTEAETEALWLSLKVSFWSVGLSLPLAILLGWFLARFRFRGKTLFESILHLPLVLPPVVTGYLLLVAFGRHGIIGAWLYDFFGFSFAFRWTGAALASAIMGFPLMERAIELSAESVDPKLEQAAATLGAGRWRVFRTVTLPLMFPGILTGAVLSFGRSLGEFGATITFVSNIPGETRTLPLAIYTETQVPGGDEAAARLVAVSILLSVAALIAAEVLARRAKRRLHGA
ncbi:MAG TPA: molybdate ABC transporter permease subunit [Stellaceae bacterium]|nr:molybdate ABC transporter permease subunit [Stellaceae bacterium]